MENEQNYQLCQTGMSSVPQVRVGVVGCAMRITCIFVRGCTQSQFCLLQLLDCYWYSNCGINLQGKGKSMRFIVQGFFQNFGQGGQNEMCQDTGGKQYDPGNKAYDKLGIQTHNL